MYTGCVLSEPELKMYGTVMTTSAITAQPVGTVVVGGDRFATQPGLAAVPAPAPTYRPFNEEELHTSFEHAISDRVLAVNRMLTLQGERRITTGLLSSQMMPLMPSALLQVAPVVAQVVRDKQPRKKSLSLLSSNRWLRGITYSSFALMLMLVGFDLMGMLVLFNH